jgi:Putative prokaryotic signal transducing protein
MGDINLLVVQTFGSQQEADMAKGALESAGIDAIIQADSVGGMRPHIAWASGGIKLLVREEDEATAREILAPHKEHA